MRCPRCNGTGVVEATIGVVIRERRLALNLTQEQLAARAGLSRNIIVKIETDHGNPTLHTLNTILGVLDCELRISKTPEKSDG